MIPETHRSAVIINGIHFMRAITDAYGADQGLKLWETIADTIDPEIKGAIFLAMITGAYTGHIDLRGLTARGLDNPIGAIRELRTWTGLDLRGAKDIVDALKTADAYQINKRIKVGHKDYHRAVHGLREAGFIF